MYITINDNKRILRATYDKYDQEGDISVDALPTGATETEKDITNYLYVNGESIYDPLPQPEPPVPSGETTDDVLNALLGIDGGDADE